MWHTSVATMLISLLLQSSGIAAKADSKYAEYQEEPKVHNHMISVALRVWLYL